jgi:hypothetical protein
MHALHRDCQLPLPTDLVSGIPYLAVIREVCANHANEPQRWRIDGDLDGTWILVRHDQSHPPGQGWKLHISASLWTANAVLRQALSVLLSEAVSLKVAASPDVLAGLNDGSSGHLSQIGKFITVYPNDDSQAVRLAIALDEATRGLSGPPVPSDHPLRRGSLVHYRYGGFETEFIQSPLGEITLALRTPSGELVPDVRTTFYQAPDWVNDPFESARLVESPTAPSRVIGNRFAIATPLHQSPRGTVLLALDVDALRSCILKQAPAGAQPAPDGSDARQRLRHEAAILKELAPDDRVPEVFGLIEQEDALYLAMEDIEGETLEELVARLCRRGSTLPMSQVLDFAVQLASMLETIHSSGYAYRDLKPTNVIVAPGGRLRFVDFDLAAALSAEIGATPGSGSIGVGTRGYMSPQQAKGEAPTVTDDVYSLGALLFLMVTGAEPSRAPNPFALLERPLKLLNPAIAPGLAGIIRKCLDPEPAARFSSMAVVESALRAIDLTLGVPSSSFVEQAAHEPECVARQNCRDLAHRLADALCAEARPIEKGAGVAWVSPHKSASGLWSRDLNVGSGGTLLALAELVADLGEPVHRTILAEGGRWLTAAPRPAGVPLAGLYVGEAGVGAALLRAGQVLVDDTLVENAFTRGNWIATLPFTSPDVMNGTAGRLRFHLLLWDATGDPRHLDHALAAGQHLLATSSTTGKDERCWTVPPGFGDLSGAQPLGYAHGAAGIADALLDLYEATGEERFRAAARQAGHWLARQALPALDDGTGLAWPMSPGGEPMPAYWCHGASGIGQFFLHAAAIDLLPEAVDCWMGAAEATARGTRWAAPTQCHGLSGNIEFLLDAYQASSDPDYLADARLLGQLLIAFRSDDGGNLRWPSDWPWIFSPDYMVGYAGVAMALLRLADPEHRPRGLSRPGFRYPGAAALEKAGSVA